MIVESFLSMVIAHAVCDYPLQGDFLAKAKNPSAPIAGIPWQWAMGAHAAIHAGAVWMFTGSLLLACCEFAAHWIIDSVKCAGGISFGTDQALHIACKAAWAICGGAP